MSWETVIGDAVGMEGQLDVQELQRDLARKRRNVGTKVDALWRGFTPKQREKAMRESTGDGVVLKHRRDRSLGDLHQYIPECNLREMTSQSEHFLDIFKHRATTPLHMQLYEAANGDVGDREMMEKTGMRYAGVSSQERTFFIEGEYYGRSFTPTAAAGNVFPGLPSGNAANFILPRALGELILLRHMYLL